MQQLIRKYRPLLIIGTLVIFVIVQVIPYGHNRANPPVLASLPGTRLVRDPYFMKTCGDCHSNETVWPWYSNIAPFSWLVYHHVIEGRNRLNISASGLSSRIKAGHAVEHYIHNEMPLESYLLAHPVANFNESRSPGIDRRDVCSTFGSEFRNAEEIGD